MKKFMLILTKFYRKKILNSSSMYIILLDYWLLVLLNIIHIEEIEPGGSYICYYYLVVQKLMHPLTKDYYVE